MHPSMVPLDIQQLHGRSHVSTHLSVFVFPPFPFFFAVPLSSIAALSLAFCCFLGADPTLACDVARF
jgi:hypothetical protein